jgi:hypothetical protein
MAITSDLVATVSRASAPRAASPEDGDRIELSGSFLGALSPERSALAGLLFYLLLAAVAPITPTVEINLLALAYVGACYLAFVSGVAVCRALTPSPTLAARIRIRPLSLVGFLFVLGVALIGIALRVLDRFVVREVPFGDDFSAVRQQLQSSEATLLSAAGAGLYPAAFVTIIAYYLLPERRRSLVLGIAAYLAFLYPALEAGLQGSRSLIMISFAFILLSRQLLPDAFGILRRPAIFSLAFLLLTYGLFAIFEMRLEAAGTDFIASSQLSGYAFTVPPSKTMAELLLVSDGPIRLLASIVLHISQYYCHSGYELMYIFDRLPDQPLFGAYNFFHAFKLLSLLTGDTSLIDQAQAVDIRSGVFATFFVPLFVDFGWLGIVVMFGFGVVSTMLWRAANRRPVVWFPLLAYVTIVLFLMPVMSLIVAAQGLYTIAALTLVGLGLAMLEHEPVALQPPDRAREAAADRPERLIVSTTPLRRLIDRQS